MDSKIVIVDEATGPLMPQRTGREGVHPGDRKPGRFAAVRDPSETIARLSFQQFFQPFGFSCPA